jgi:hypothetical protein
MTIPRYMHPPRHLKITHKFVNKASVDYVTLYSCVQLKLYFSICFARKRIFFVDIKQYHLSMRFGCVFQNEKHLWIFFYVIRAVSPTNVSNS